MEMKAITDHFGAGESAVLSVLAGVDMVLFSHSRKRQEAAMNALAKAVETGRIPASRVDQAATRIQGLIRKYALRNGPPLGIIGSTAHRNLSRRAARAATALLRDDGLLPLSPKSESVVYVEFVTESRIDFDEFSAASTLSGLLRQSFPLIACRVVTPTQMSTHIAEEIRNRHADADLLILATRDAHLSPRQLAAARGAV